jgi:FtsP/CotA-like multicopper oxidase with cupredoxin domain
MVPHQHDVDASAGMAGLVATAIHWHGIELDSYFDGVPGWGGTAGSVTPPIAAGQRFTAKFTPPRAGWSARPGAAPAL